MVGSGAMGRQVEFIRVAAMADAASIDVRALALVAVVAVVVVQPAVVASFAAPFGIVGA